MSNHRLAPRLVRIATALVFASAFSACAPLIVGGAMLGTGLVAADRRTTGTQIDDEGIELRAASRIRELATLGQISVTSYNRQVLITGEVPGAAERVAVEQAVAKVDGVRGVFNEIVVAPNSAFSSRSADTVLSTKVKATLVDQFYADVQALGGQRWDSSSLVKRL